MFRLRTLFLILAALTLTAACGSSSSASESAEETTTTEPGETTTTTAVQTSDGAETAPVTVSGAALPQLEGGGVFSDEADDPAIGSVAPTLTGTNFNGSEVSIGPDGRAKVVYFLAHWCPHCQDEVNLINELVADGVQPSEIDLYAVTIAVDETRPNYPPSEWLENFPGTVMRDSAENEAGLASGISGIPYTLYLDGENNLIARSVGSLEKDQVLNLWNVVASGA